jgi:hypothetical protein
MYIVCSCLLFSCTYRHRNDQELAESGYLMKNWLEDQLLDNFYNDLDVLEPYRTSSQDQIDIVERKYNDPDENLMELMRWIESIQESNMIELAKQLKAKFEKAEDPNKGTVTPIVEPGVDSIAENLATPSLTSPPLRSTSSSIREQLPNDPTTLRIPRIKTHPTKSSTAEIICATGTEVFPAGTVMARMKTAEEKSAVE